MPMPREHDQRSLAPDGRPEAAQPAWRKDFPVDWAEDHYVARRDFTKFMVLVSLGLTVGQFWIGVQNYLRKRRWKPFAARVITVKDMPAGGMVTFNYPGPDDPCILVRTAANDFIAYGQKCTHLSCAVVPDLKSDCIHCPCHEGCFDLSSGRPIAGPPRRPLPKVTLTIRSGAIYATGVVERTT
jgi:Rieske Fe-S protein